MAGRSTESLDLTEMLPPEQKLREIARIERLRTLRNWALCGALVAVLLAMSALGIVESNPSKWSNAHIAFAAQRWLRWSVATLLAIGAALAIAGALLHGLSKRKYGEV